MIKLFSTAAALILLSTVSAGAQTRYGSPQSAPNGRAGNTGHPAATVTPGFTNPSTGRTAPNIYVGPRGGVFTIDGSGNRRY